MLIRRILSFDLSIQASGSALDVLGHTVEMTFWRPIGDLYVKLRWVKRKYNINCLFRKLNIGRYH